MTRQRSTRREVRDMEARITLLVDALAASGDAEQADLAQRLWQCQQERQARRQGHTTALLRQCRMVACEHCRRWRGKRWRTRAAEQMAQAENEHATMVTVVIARTGCLDAAREVVQTFRLAVRNLRARLARDDARWRAVGCIARVEIDLLDAADVPRLPPVRRSVVEALPVLSPSSACFVVHAHVMVVHPGLPRDVVEDAFGRQWPGPRRVHAKPFHDDATAAANASAITGYATKHAMANEMADRKTVPVPLPLQARYWGWLHGMRNGLSPLHFRVSPMRAVAAVKEAPLRPSALRYEPMPLVG